MVGWRSRRPAREAPAGPAVVGPAELGIPPDAPLPVGIRLDLDVTTQRLAPDALFGGAPGRVLRLSSTGLRALGELCGGPVSTPAGEGSPAD